MGKKKTGRIVALALVASLGTAVLLVVGVIGYIWWGIYAARTSTQTLCAEYTAGKPVAGLIERAGALGITGDVTVYDDKGNRLASSGRFLGAAPGSSESPAQALRSTRRGEVSCMAVGFVFLRYICNVSFEGGVVTGTRLTTLD